MPVKVLLVNAINHKAPIETHHPPLGFGYLAGTLREEFKDQLIFKVINGDIVNNIKAFNPDIVAITAVTKNYAVAKQYAQVAKECNIPTLIGGVHITFLPQTLTDDMDVGIMGEGDLTIVELMSFFLANGRFDKTDLANIKGIVFKDEAGKLIVTDARPFIKNLDTIPYPARDLLKIHKSAHMLSSRGCPYHCRFCSATKVTGNKSRYASADYVVEEMAHIYNTYGIEYLTIYDEQFAMNNKRVIKIQELMAAKNLIGKFKIAVNIRADYVTDELASLLHQMNVDVVALGTESGSQKTLDYLKCGSLKVEDNIRAIEILTKHKLRPYCSFVIGSPDETLADMMETMDFIITNRLHWFDVSILVPFPGTEVWDYALKIGKVSIDMDWNRLDFYMSPNSVNLSKHLTIKEMSKIRAKVMAKKTAYYFLDGLQISMKHPIYTFKSVINKIKRR